MLHYGLSTVCQTSRQNIRCFLHCLPRSRQLIKRGFQPTQRTQRKERTEMRSLLDRLITAASDDGVCRWHAAKAVVDTREIIAMKFDLHHKLHNK